MSERFGIDVDGTSEICEKQFYVKSLTLFGSALTEDFDPEHSDDDFLGIPGRSTEPYPCVDGVKADLEAFLQQDVDLVIGYSFLESVLRSNGQS